MEDAIREALRFVGVELRENPSADRLKLIDEAAQKFDLNPMQTEFLTDKISSGSRQ